MLSIVIYSYQTVIYSYIVLDMSKAFDSVDHNMLLQRILNLGVSSAVHKWFNLKVTCLTDGSMLGLELPLRRLLHCRTEFLKALFYRRFYLIYTQIACLQFPTVVVLKRMLTIRKHFYRFHCRIWNTRYCK